MGDRVYASISFRNEYFPLVNNLFKKKQGEPLEDYYVDVDTATEEGIATIGDEHANYGNMEELTPILDVLEIDYNHHYTAGSEFPAGFSYQRWSKNVEEETLNVELADHSVDKMNAYDLLKFIDAGTIKTLEDVKNYAIGHTLEHKLKGHAVSIIDVPLRELTEEEIVIVTKEKMLSS